MRTKSEIIKDSSECRQLLDRSITTVGQLYGQYYKSNDQKLIQLVNEKVEVVKILESRLKELDNELMNVKD